MSNGEVLVDKGAVYIRVNLHCILRVLIVLLLFHSCICCTVFVLIYTVVVLYCFVMCGVVWCCVVCVCVCKMCLRV